MDLKSFLFSLLITALAGGAAIFEKASLQGATPLVVFTLRSLIMTTCLLAACFLTNSFKVMTQVSGRTFLLILIPALFATTFVWMYFSILKNDLASRVFPIMAAAPLVTVILSVIFLGEPFSWKRLIGVILVVVGVSLVK